MGEWTMDANFRFDEGERDGAHGVSGYTWEEFCAKTRPACPVCGDPVDVNPVVMGGLAAVDLYMPGSVTCLNGCQPPR